MNRTEKLNSVEELKNIFDSVSYFYVTDTTGLSVEKINNLRRTCFEKDIQIKVVKNTLAIKALEQLEDSKNFQAIFDAFKGQSTVLFSTDGKKPALTIKEFRGKGAKPMLKAAYIDSDVFFGDDQLELLTKLKTKNELIGEIIGLLQSPAKNVLSALNSGGATLAGLVKALEERQN